jgi:hypothetical protein
VKPADVESLLAPQNRAGLPLGRQFLLYLDPFALFKDASQGPTPARERALSYNRAMRWVLVTYLRRWVVIALTLFLSITPAEALAARESAFVITAAASAVGCCIAVAVCAVIGAVYLLLGSTKYP